MCVCVCIILPCQYISTAETHLNIHPVITVRGLKSNIRTPFYSMLKKEWNNSTRVICKDQAPFINRVKDCSKFE